MKKIYCVALAMISLLGLVSCNKAIPEGDIKDFVNNLSYEKAYDFVKTGYSKVRAVQYTDGKLEGSIVYQTIVDTEDKYYYYDTSLTGSYYGTDVDQFNYYNSTTIVYLNAENITSLKKTDNIKLDYTCSDSEFTTNINSFFYNSEESGYHSGGMYYGDTVAINCGDFYDFFSLDESKEVLTYEINSIKKDANDKNIITIHKFSINSYGMLLNLHTKSFYEEDDTTYIETFIECVYNQPINKIYSFE